MILGALLLLVLLLLFILLLLLVLLLLILLLLRVLLGRPCVTARGLRGATTSSGPAHLLVVCLMLGQDLLSHLLLSLVDVRVEFVSVLSNRELLVVVNWDEDLLSADWLFIWVVELGHVRVLKGLLGGESLSWVEL